MASKIEMYQRIRLLSRKLIVVLNTYSAWNSSLHKNYNPFTPQCTKIYLATLIWIESMKMQPLLSSFCIFYSFIVKSCHRFAKFLVFCSSFIQHIVGQASYSVSLEIFNSCWIFLVSWFLKLWPDHCTECRRLACVTWSDMTYKTHAITI